VLPGEGLGAGELLRVRVVVFEHLSPVDFVQRAPELVEIAGTRAHDELRPLAGQRGAWLEERAQRGKDLIGRAMTQWDDFKGGLPGGLAGERRHCQQKGREDRAAKVHFLHSNALEHRAWTAGRWKLCG